MNLIFSFGWDFLDAIKGSVVKWFYAHSMPLSKPRVAIIMVFVVINFCMDCLPLYLGRFHILYPLIRRNLVPRRDPLNREGLVSKKPFSFNIVCVVIVLEIICIVLCSIGLVVWGIKGFGRWIYSALQGLVWVKWAANNYVLSELVSKYDYDPIMCIVYETKRNAYSGEKWTYNVIFVYSFEFLLNAFLVGVPGQVGLHKQEQLNSNKYFS